MRKALFTALITIGVIFSMAIAVQAADFTIPHAVSYTHLDVYKRQV